MAEKFSEGLREAVLGDKSFRDLMCDSVLNIYSGAAPSSPDDPISGSLLLKVTRAGGAVVANTHSFSEVGNIVIGSDAIGEVFAIRVTIDGVGPVEYLFTNTPDVGDVNDVARRLARVLNNIPGLHALSTGQGGYIAVGAVPGIAFTLALGPSNTGTTTVNDGVDAAIDLNTLRFDTPPGGAIAKPAGDTWSGVGLADGTAGYFRLVTTDDDGLLSSTQPRVQGSVSTSGAELNLSSIAIRTGAVVTVTTFSVSIPES
jgi:hypothetical protein